MKKYQVKVSGTGYSPHILQNAEDQNDSLSLCSCGGTKNEDGTCDGTHKMKPGNNCQCAFCLPQAQRAKMI